MNSHNDFLRKLYYNPVTGLGTARSLFLIAKKEEPKIKFNDVKKFVSKQETNQVFHTNKKINYPAIIGHTNNDYQLDLMFFDEYKSKNDGYHVILTAIEITSRKAYAYPLKNKTEASIIEAFKKFLDEVKTVTNLTTDNGSEFISKAFKKVIDDYQITHFFVEAGDKNKMGKIERFNRTIRDKIAKYLKTYKTLRWINVIDDLMTNYNNSIHSRTGYSPNKVNNKRSEKIRNKERDRSTLAYDLINSFSVGDKVRVLKNKDIFEKGQKTYTKGIYTIEKIDKLALIVKNSKGETIDRRIKPYRVIKVTESEKAPELDIEKHSASKNKREYTRERNLKKDFDVVEDGKVIHPPKLIPVNEKRVKVDKIGVGTRVQAWFSVNKEKKLFYGVVKKVNPNTYNIDFDDGDKLRLNKSEVKVEVKTGAK